MEYKVLVTILVPEIEKNFEIYLPVNKTIGEVLILINKLINENIMELSFFIVGFIFIFFVFYLKVMTKKAFRKNSYLDTEYNYQFSEDKVLMKAISHNVSGTSEMTYDFFDFYYVSDSSLYLKAKGKRYFYVVNNDGYESGSVDELMKLLEGKVIRK